ncbi:alpha amylase, catalytic domain protein [Necator americanus]|uniref:Alpha amylase, catalytic domain protein n=1 Tax=Necator americanus TaxID=51031 RepID=W2TFA6_NECAM|nr:alpha amylase, catalytic domain protein [Necator americanus]ETN80523.1 alpha amylase, catalytic domain protein [Necator americanus]
MAAKQALMAEEGKSGQAVFEKTAEKVNFELEPKTIGLTKEQLEKYRNDPFWKPLRTVLFALFWIAWVAMFAGAILIVVLSPKCAEKQKPEWWQTKVSYQLLTPTFHDTDNDGVGDFKGVTEKIDLLKKIGVTTIYPSPVIEIQKDEYFNPYDVVDHLQVDKRFGTEEDFKELIDAAHNRDMYVVMDLPVTSVSIHHPWFRDGDADVFVTAKKGSAAFAQANYHEFHGDNDTKYLGYPSAANPVLNWSNAKVKETIEEAAKKYLLLGLDGFHIDHVSQLALDATGKPNHDGAIAALKELTSLIKNVIESQENLKEKKIVLSSSLRDIEELHSKARETGDLHYVIDNTFASLSSEKCAKGVAACAHDALSAAYSRHESDSYTPYWQFSNADSSRLASRFDADTANLFTFMQLTLPGALSLYYGQELGLKDVGNPPSARGIMQWTPTGNDHHGFLSSAEANIGKLFFAESDDDKEEDNFESQYAQEMSPLKVYQKLAKMRQRDEALILGSTVRDELEGDVLAYSRFVKGENGTAVGTAFVIALNFGSNPAPVDFTKLNEKELLPKNVDLAKAEVGAVTPGVTEYRARQKLDLANEKITLPAKQGVLVRL